MTNKVLLQNLLRQNSFYMLNKDLIKQIGLIETAVLSLLIDRHNVNGDDFYVTANTAKEQLNLGRRPYESAIETLKGLGLITTTLKGLPARTHFTINYDAVASMIDTKDIEQTSLYKTGKQDCPKCTTNKKQINKKQTNNIPPYNPPKGESECGDSTETSSRKKKFIKPTPSEVQVYCDERHNGINGEEFCDFYESKGWVVGSSPMKDWKACVRTWERKRTKEIKEKEETKKQQEKNNHIWDYNKPHL